MEYFGPGTDSAKFENFNILETPYKTVNGQDINAYIAIPKDAKPGKHPVIVKWHGGGYCTGSAMYPDWFPVWLISYIHAHNAILIAPNYRLIPESTGPDMVSDVSSFWDWIHTSLPSLLSKTEETINIFGPGIVANLDQILVMGESSGGTLALVSALHFSNLGDGKGKIRACIATYPAMLAFESERYVENLEKMKLQRQAPDIPISLYEDHIASMIPGQIITSATPPARLPLFIVAAQHGLFIPLLQGDDRLFPLKALDMVEKGIPPHILIIHGRQDTVTMVEDSEEFVEKSEKKLGKGSAELVIQDGDHGFDVKVELDTEWLAEALKKPTELWLGKDA